MSHVVGDVIAGRFELIDVISSGASGTVWRAADLRHSRVVAAKVMRQRASVDLMRFARENSVRIDHPHLVAPYAFVVEDEYVVIGMPLLHGGTLAHLTHEHGALSDELAALLLVQLCSGLAAVHERGWIHRDVKPANLLLSASGDALPRLGLADFGIAVHRDDHRLTATGFVNGTPGYVAPEIERGGAISPAQDMWAAGVVALQSVAPQVAVGPAGAHAAEVQTALGGIRPELAHAITALLAADPAQRPSAQAIVDGLSPFAASAAMRTRDGNPLHLADRLPPLPEASRWRDTDELAPGAPELAGTDVLGRARTLPERPAAVAPSPALPSPAAASAASPAPSFASPAPGFASPAPASAPPPAQQAAPLHPSPSPWPDDDPTVSTAARSNPRPRRRGWGLGILGALALVAAAVLTALAVIGPLGGGDRPVDEGLRAGTTCTFAEENRTARAEDGTPVRCTVQDDGGYRWERG